MNKTGYENINARPRLLAWDWVLFAALLLLMSFGIGSYGLYEPHEAQYGGGAQEMLQRKDWITPYLNGWPELNKPPFFYWLISIGYLLLGNIAKPEFCARFPQSLIAIAGAFIAWRWAFELWGRRAARLAAAMLVLSAGWWVFGHQLLIDELLGTLFLLGLYFLWKGITSGKLLHWSLFYFVMGIAMLAKGLLGIAFLGGVLVIYAAIKRNWGLIGQAKPILGILILLLVIGPWAVLYERQNPGALEYMVINEHFNRLMDTRVPHDYEVVQTDAITFLLITFVWLMPWGLFTPEIARFAWNQIRTNGGESVPAKESVDSRREGVILLSIGFLLVVGFFTVVPSRLIYYALPAIPPFMVLCAGAFDSWLDGMQKKLVDFALPILCGVGLILAGPLVPKWIEFDPDMSAVFGSKAVIGIAAAAGGLVFLAAALLLRRQQVMHAILALAALVCTLEVYSLSKFEALDAIYSSKKLVAEFSTPVTQRIAWITEASEEVGASAGITYYLRNKGAPSQVLIVESKRRPPPCYPGARPSFLLNEGVFAEKWNSDQPALFVTDFARTDWVGDVPKLPMHYWVAAVQGVGHRRVYANEAAAKILQAAHVDVTPNRPDVKNTSSEIEVTRARFTSSGPKNNPGEK